MSTLWIPNREVLVDNVSREFSCEFYMNLTMPHVIFFLIERG